MACRNGVCSRNSPAPRRQTSVAMQPIQQNRVVIPEILPPQQPQQRGWFDAFKEWWKGRPAQDVRVSRGYSEPQRQNLDMLAQMGMSGLQQNRGYQNDIQALLDKNRGQFSIDEITDRARRDYYNETLPTIANRFLAGNTRNSSGFQHALTSGGRDLEASLAALRNQFGQQQHQNLLNERGQLYNQEGNYLNQAQLGLQPQEDVFHDPGEFGAAVKIFPALAKYAATFAIGGMPAVLAKLGADVSSEESSSEEENQKGEENKQTAPIQGQQGVRQPQNPWQRSSSSQRQQQGGFQQPFISQAQRNEIQPTQLQDIQRQQNQYGQVFMPQSQLDYIQNVVQRMGTPDYKFPNRRLVAQKPFIGY